MLFHSQKKTIIKKIYFEKKNGTRKLEKNVEVGHANRVSILNIKCNCWVQKKDAVE